MRQISPAVVAVLSLSVALVAAAQVASAQTGATLTPNQRNYMVNKDIAEQRWTINVNLSADDPTAILNVTGNIFRSDGAPPSFVLCQVRPDSTGTLADAASAFRFTCRGADACLSTATQCARDDWRPIDDDVQIPASFFLPPGGLGGGASAAARSRADQAEGLAGRFLDAVARAWTGLRGWLAGGSELASPRSAHAQASGRGATLSLDGLNFLVNKDVGAERWSISLNFVPTQSGQGGVETRLESLTGNVFQPDGSPPSFVFCTVRDDSTGSLEVPSSEFRFSCQGTSACASTALECAQTQWQPIADDIPLAASFFLPPGGLPAGVQSDPEIVIIGRTSDPPSIVTGDFTTSEGTSAAGTAGGCAEGATCFATQIGSCQSVRGRLADIEGFGCGCYIENVDAQCITCGGGSSGQCGGNCEFPVGGAQARGVCLPFSLGSSDCACYAVGAGQSQTVQGCGGTLGAGCPGDRCCADDPRDGCDPLGGNAGCFGVCVAADGCNPALEQCGSCLAPGGQFCGNGSREGSESCDGLDLGGQSCGTLGFAGGGSLRCTSSCGFDTSGCGDGGDNPPRIVGIDFPSFVDADAGPAGGSIAYSDPDGDIIRVNFQPIDGNISPFSFDPAIFGRASGSFSFFINCNGNVEDFILAVTLQDEGGNLSQIVTFGWSCVSAQAECGNGIIESGEECDPPGSQGGCSASQLCTNDCSQCVSATSCQGRCCPGRDDSCTPPSAPCFCDEACVDFDDCCNDITTACGFF